MGHVNANTRKKMEASKHLWAFHWNEIVKDLEEAAQRRLTESDIDRRLSAESKWWYFFFWLSYAFKNAWNIRSQ